MGIDKYWSLFTIHKDMQNPISFKKFIQQDFAENGVGYKFNEPKMFAALVIPIIVIGVIFALLFSMTEIQPTGISGGLLDIVAALPFAIIIFIVFAYYSDYKEYKAQHAQEKKECKKFLNKNPECEKMYDRFVEADEENKARLDERFLQMRTHS